MERDDAYRRARLDAEAWRVRLDVRRISSATVRALFQWRQTPIHREAYELAERKARARAAAVEAREHLQDR